MHMLRTSLFAALGLGALAGAASANGFFVYEHDARWTGRASAATATTDGPSSILFNPGGLALGEGFNFTLGAAALSVRGSYYDTNDNRTDTDGSPVVVPSAFVSWRLNDMIAVGFGAHLPFGLSASWPDDHPQADTIQDEALRTYFLTPSVGVNLDKQVPGLSLGAGLDLVPATVTLERAIIFPGARGSAELGGDAFGVGGRFGVMYRPPMLNRLHVGAMWRSQVNLDFEGTGDFDIDPSFRPQLPPDGDISTSISLPQSVTGGVAFDATPELQLELNAMWMDWSVFKELRINLPGGTASVAPQNYEDTVTIRAGGEYALANRKAAVRLGYIYDPTPIPGSTITAQLPDADRHIITAGGSYKLGNYMLNLGLIWLPATSQETEDDEYMPVFKGKYEVAAYVANFSITGTLGK
jgi:long-chain fatty acid transport protein